MSRSGLSPARLVVGITALVAIVVMGLLLPQWGRLQLPAVVVAARTFTLGSIAPGHYHWSLRDGRSARGDGLIREKILRFEQTELIELELSSGLATGDQVQAQQTLAILQSLRAERRADELQAERAALLARRSLLAAGSRPEEIVEAGKRVAVARAELTREQAELTRIEALAVTGLASAQELESHQQLVEIRRRQVELALAGEGVKRSSARIEAIAEVEAELAAIDSHAEETAGVIGEGLLRSPLAGVVELGGDGVELQVFDLSAVYLRMPIADQYRGRVDPGSELVFYAPAPAGTRLRAEIVDVTVAAVSSRGGGSVFWASARVDDPQHLLRPGMTGIATLVIEGTGANPLADFWRYLLGERL